MTRKKDVKIRSGGGGGELFPFFLVYELVTGFPPLVEYLATFFVFPKCFSFFLLFVAALLEMWGAGVESCCRLRISLSFFFLPFACCFFGQKFYRFLFLFFGFVA